MENRLIDIIKKHKWIFIAFVLLFITYIICNFKSHMGLFFDIPAMFLTALKQAILRDSNYLLFFASRVRFFCDLLVSVPLNIYFNLFHPQKFLDLISFYSASYFIIHFFALSLNFLAALRTKRYDIAIFAFAFYTFFSMSNAIWSVREIHIAVLFQFILLSYFLSKQKLNKWDAIPILLLIIFMFESFEIVIPFGIMMFIVGYAYSSKKRDELNPGFKILIIMGSLFAAIYTAIKMLIINFTILGSGLSEWIFGIKTSFEHLFKSNLIISVWAVIFFIFIIFYKKELTEKLYYSIPLLLVPTLIGLYLGTHFYPNPNIEINFSGIVLVLIIPIEFIIILLDIFNVDIEKYNKAFFSNLFFIACFIGIINLCWQINSCKENLKYINYMKDLLNTSQETIIEIPIEAYDKYDFMKFDTCFGTLHKSFFLSDNYLIDKIFYPNVNSYAYNPYCNYDGKYTFYNKTFDSLLIQSTPMFIRTRFYDATPIKEELEKRGQVVKISAIEKLLENK